jgi:hypothetical protein
LRAAGFDPGMEDVWMVAREDWRGLFKLETWHMKRRVILVDAEKSARIRNLEAVGPALRRLAIEDIRILNCPRLQNVDALKGLSSLQVLIIFSCPGLQNVDALAGLPALRDLTLFDCSALQNVDALKRLTTLQNMVLADCTALQNVDALGGFTALENINLDGCINLSPESVAGLKGLPVLRSLALAYGPVQQNVDFLKGFTALQFLDLTGCDELDNLDALYALPALERITIIHCPKLSPATIAAFHAARPQTVIVDR